MTSLPCGARLRHSEQSPRHPVIFIRVLASHTYRNLDPPVCDICGTIPDFTAASLREGEALPRGGADLVDVYPTPEGFWDTSQLPAGTYVVRVYARDIRGNEAKGNRELKISIGR